MIQMLILRLLLVALVGLIVLAVLERFNPARPEMLIAADYQECVPMNPKGPVRRPTKPVLYPHNSETV